jgi:hypothetical protein
MCVHMCVQSSLVYLGNWFQDILETPIHTKIHGVSRLLHKMTVFAHNLCTSSCTLKIISNALQYLIQHNIMNIVVIHDMNYIA